MKHALLCAALLIVGCQNGASAKKAANEEEEKVETPVGKPSPPGPSKLFLLGENSLLRLGDDAGDAQKVFPPPKGSFPLSELPDKFRPPYAARGWDAAREGFGVILYEDRIVAAMVQSERADPSTADELRGRYNRELSSIAPVEIRSETANYTFWEDDTQRLMLLVQKSADKSVRTTVALGDRVVMDALGANIERARQDGQQLDALLKESKENADGKAESGVEKTVPEGQGGGAS